MMLKDRTKERKSRPGQDNATDDNSPNHIIRREKSLKIWKLSEVRKLMENYCIIQTIKNS